ncbi:right-handed parallel beta-helix repeat-containing protein [Microbispora sp. NPDC046933]|uniref:right-handed parallel beta-helix repeat-containing protein n=1 Tax=Microbispora sp. NPDC046933 TaxID=3155618 RepID=UPI0033DEDBDA
MSSSNPGTPPSRLKRRGFLYLSTAAAAVTATAGLGARPAAADPPPPGPGGFPPYTPPTGAIIASSFGFDPADSTAYLKAALQAALAATNSQSTRVTLVIDRQDGDWVTGPLSIGAAAPYLKGAAPLTIVFAPGVTVRGKAGAFDGSGNDACLLSMMGPNSGPDNGKGVSDVTLLGYGATLTMNREEFNAGEWRHLINLLSCKNIVIEGLTLRGAGGDGIYLGQQLNAVGYAKPYCSDIHVVNVHCDDNRRNGMSVATVDGLTVTGCAFSGSTGAPPMAGIDFEPDPPKSFRPYGRLKNITVTDCSFLDNAGYGVNVNATCLAGAPADCAPLGVTLKNCRLGPTTSQIATLVVASSGDNGGGNAAGPPITGTVTVEDSLLDARVFCTGLLTEGMTAASGIHLGFTRTVLWNLKAARANTVVLGNAVSKWAPITLLANNPSAGTATQFGNIDWTACVIHSNQANPLLVAPPVSGTTCTNLTGDITAYVTAPNNATAKSLGAGANVTLTVNELTDPNADQSPTPKTTVSVAPASATVAHGGSVDLTFTRSSTDISRTMAVVYSMTGTATQRYDYDGLSGVVVFEPGKTTAKVTLNTRRPDSGTGARVATLLIGLSDAYVVDAGARSASVSIT